MNNLLLLIGIVLVVCLMNSKDLMKSVSSKHKSVSKSVSKSLGVDIYIISSSICGCCIIYVYE